MREFALWQEKGLDSEGVRHCARLFNSATSQFLCYRDFRRHVIVGKEADDDSASRTPSILPIDSPSFGGIIRTDFSSPRRDLFFAHWSR
jgi:hypothetical protein